MAKRVYVTRRIPQPGIDLLTEAGFEVEVSPHDRVLTREELLAAVKGRDGLLPLLTDGMDSEVIGARLAADTDGAAIVEAAGRISKMGISGVPCFVVDSQYVISGAQGPEHFVQLFDALAAQAQTEPAAAE